MNKLITAAFVLFLASGAYAQNRGTYSYPDQGRNNPRTNTNVQGRYDNRLSASDREDAIYLNRMQREARLKIADGIANGSLTSHESIRLLNEFERINQKERRYLSNHNLTRRETRELSQDLEKLIKGIHYEKNDFDSERDRLVQRRYE